MPEEARQMLCVFDYNRNQLSKNLHWCLTGISGSLELGLLLLIEISRNFVTCFSGQTAPEAGNPR